jgi:hypothetical protein
VDYHAQICRCGQSAVKTFQRCGNSYTWRPGIHIEAWHARHPGEVSLRKKIVIMRFQPKRAYCMARCCHYVISICYNVVATCVCVLLQSTGCDGGTWDPCPLNGHTLN